MSVILTDDKIEQRRALCVTEGPPMKRLIELWHGPFPDEHLPYVPSKTEELEFDYDGDWAVAVR